MPEVFRLNLPLPWKSTLHFLVKTTAERTQFHYGIGNRTSDAEYVVFLDYDDTPLEWIEEEVKMIQEWTPCSTAYLFKTQKGYHVVFLEKFFLDNLIRILQMTSVDKNYLSVPLKYAKKTWVLRQTKKGESDVTFIGTIKKKPTIERSTAHRDYLVRYHHIGEEHFPEPRRYWDEHKTLVLGYYYAP